MTKIININITSPTSEFPYQKSLSVEMPLVEFKRRIELVVGIYSADMQLTLLNADNKYVCELKQEGQTLAELGVQDGFTVKVEDRSGRYENPLAGDVDHYRINDESYRQRNENFLNFKKKAIPPYIAVGNRCVVVSKTKGERSGVISFVGEVHFKPDEIMVGVTLDQPNGKHDGSVDGQRYFECQAPHGIFVDRKFVKPEITEQRVPEEKTDVEEAMEEV